MALPRWCSGEESACNAGATGDANLIPGLGRSPPQCSCLENSMNRGAWRTIIHGDAKNWTRLSD